MNRRLTTCLALAAIASVAVLTWTAADSRANRGDGALGAVFVTSQGLYFDTFVSAQTLPPQGPFQLLENGVTAFGPGDPGYLGGRWKIPDGEGGYTYLLCPLLPPGRENR